MEEVYKTDLKTMEHATHDIVENIKFCQQLMVPITQAASIPSHIIYLTCGVIAIISGIISTVLGLMTGKGFLEIDFSVTLVLAIVSVLFYVLERVVRKSMIAGINYTIDKIIHEGLKTTIAYPFLSKEEIDEIGDSIKRYHTSNKKDIELLQIMRKTVREAEENGTTNSKHDGE